MRPVLAKIVVVAVVAAAVSAEAADAQAAAGGLVAAVVVAAAVTAADAIRPTLDERTPGRSTGRTAPEAQTRAQGLC